MKYSVKARMHKPWWAFRRQSKIVFDIIAHGSAWYDPSYGNGGGEYRDYETRIATYDTAEEATIARDILNTHKGEIK